MTTVETGPKEVGARLHTAIYLCTLQLGSSKTKACSCVLEMTVNTCIMDLDQQRVRSYPLASLNSRIKDKAGRKEAEGKEEQRITSVKKPDSVQKAVSAVREHPASFAAVSAIAAYTALRAGIEVFHHTRRRFLRQLLCDLCPALEAIGQTYWVDFGSLLGMHRGGDLILHDNDIDLAILNPDWDALLEALRPHLAPKYNIKVVTPKETPETHWVRVYCPLGMADLFGAYDNGGEKIRIDFGHGDMADVDRKLVLPTGRMEFRGEEVCVPHDIEGTLEYRYGPTWRTPRYMDKGTDTVESAKLYARIFRALSFLGIRL